MVRAKNSRVSLVVQAGVLRSVFPNSEVKRKGEDSLTWTHTLTPSPLSDNYQVKLHYRRNQGVNFYVIKPKLVLASGHSKLPHVYSTPEQQLCLYYPKTKEWDVSMLYTRTIIPWACEWLYHYELWVATGDWHGGGIAHENEAEKQNTNDN